MRIASLLPAATEIVGALGLDDRLVAVTFECDHPAGIRDRCPVVVDTALPHGMTPAEIDAVVRDRAARGLPMYSLDSETLARADPDLILTQDLCRVCALPQATVDEAQTAIGTDARVLSLDPHTLDEVFSVIAEVADAAGAAPAADALLAGLHARLDAIAAAVAGRPVPRVLALEWTDPPFLPGHWVPELVSRAGGEAVGAIPGGRSVGFEWSDMPGPVDVVLVAPCGFGLDDAIAQAEAVRDRLPPGVPVVALDSASFVVRTGPRLVDGIEAIAWALHPDAVPEPPPGRVRAFGARARK
ncbi:iron complex transport system substrate-binding protein [Pseudonocardia sediminis]|uniref:Iron complex transport system substrate-binding protein n=1 Tax=Pseudonocardia sediminis TaxID=1397368 RepID=A0A4Q7UZK9_PSEST|nr:ABC transporter substrate-binding protein [Pseudonocardia sediminis]RZT86558.1 iron complex transport system substrate-binding protein [Pseudonocardia sediminis]